MVPPTTSDTEVLQLFAREGERTLRLRGMFAFAIWDIQSRELFLARSAIAALLRAIKGPSLPPKLRTVAEDPGRA
jgi:hypothetical protein